ncbi:MAG: type II secretion system protein GspG [Candidatus Dependentiae bacterium]|nr:type II secretion system protein GspG [Candidatus Dependentiae bacterium]
MFSNQRQDLKPGFSFLEMMFVLAIMSLFLAFVGPKFMGFLGKGTKAVTKSTLKVVDQAIKQFKMDVGRYPDKLEDLVKRPENASRWDGPYAGEDVENPEVQKDAWDNELVYERKAPGSHPAFDLYSKGDPEKEDDRIYANNQ